MIETISMAIEAVSAQPGKSVYKRVPSSCLAIVSSPHGAKRNAGLGGVACPGFRFPPSGPLAPHRVSLRSIRAAKRTPAGGAEKTYVLLQRNTRRDGRTTLVHDAK